MSSCAKSTLDDGTVRLDIELASASYPVFWGEHAPEHFLSYIKEHFPGRKVAIIADENTAQLFGVLYESQFISAGYNVIALTVTPGEIVKTWATAGQLLDALASAHIERGDLIVSLGGGVISDLAGFVASIYLRGVAFAQISTSLLSMVDASVGGKTGVDLEAGKNLVGSFKHPLAIMMDSDTLRTLPEGEFSSGLAEVAKTAVLSGEEFCSYLLEHSNELRERDLEVVREVVTRCIAFKASVVAQDERESSARASLNYGHTLAHALEKARGYGALSHGAAVAQGMRFAARVAAQVVDADLEFVRMQDRLLDALGLEPIEFDDDPLELVDAMRNDKKVQRGEIRMVLVSAPGAWKTVKVSESLLFDHLNAWQRMNKGGKR